LAAGNERINPEGRNSIIISSILQIATVFLTVAGTQQLMFYNLHFRDSYLSKIILFNWLPVPKFGIFNITGPSDKIHIIHKIKPF
jgi:ABC-type maltose transport system permease subunit